MDTRIIGSALIAIAIVVAVVLAGRSVNEYNRTQAVATCYETSTLPYASEGGNGMYFDKEKYEACMSEMGMR